jgi:hypothetical protein
LFLENYSQEFVGTPGVSLVDVLEYVELVARGGDDGILRGLVQTALDLVSHWVLVHA